MFTNGELTYPNILVGSVDECILCRGSIIGTQALAVTTFGSLLGRTRSFTVGEEYRSKPCEIFWGDISSEYGAVECHVQLRLKPSDKHPDSRSAAAILAHEDCFVFLNAFLPRDRAIFSYIWSLALSTSTPSTISASARRHRYIELVQGCLTSERYNNILSRQSIPQNKRPLSTGYRKLAELPAELSYMIVDLSIPAPYFAPAVIFTETVPLLDHIKFLGSVRREYSKPVCLAGIIYIGIVHFRNTNYVSYFSCQRLASSDISLQLRSQVNKIRLSIDDFGICNVDFLGEDLCTGLGGFLSIPRKGLWYRILEPSHGGGISYVTGISDDVFLRNVNIGSELLPWKPLRGLIEWNTPDPPTLDRKNFCYVSPSMSNEAVKRMTVMSLDGLRGFVVGLSVPGFLTALRPWYGKVDSDILDVYRKDSYTKIWRIYPIDADEHIKEVWVRHSKKIYAPMTIILRTTSARTLTLGKCSYNSMNTDIEYYPLTSDPDGLVRAFVYDESAFNQYQFLDFGVVCDSQTQSVPRTSKPTEPPLLGRDCSQEVLRLSRSTNYTTSANMTGVIVVQICKADKPTDHSCLGMLFTYKDGSQRSVGAWRWDKPVVTYNLERTAPEYLYYFTRSEFEIVDIRFEPPLDTDHKPWCQVSVRGTTIWWFNEPHMAIAFTNTSGRIEPEQLQRPVQTKPDILVSSPGE